MQNLLLLLFYITSFYAFIPSLISRLFGFRVFRKGKNIKDYALTFDDGPDPYYTPLLLDLLKRYGVKATFFVVGEHAERNQDLLKRIHEEGHLIGIHNYKHYTNWLMSPKLVRQQIERTDTIVYQITGSHTQFYRPPWGITNLFDFSKKHHHRIVLWSGMFGDWKERIGEERLAERMRKKLRGGEVLVLHDCGTTPGADKHAPRIMLLALERILEEAKHKGLQSIRIDEMIALHNAAKKDGVIRFGKDMLINMKAGMKKVVVTLWLGWEKVFHMITHLKTITPQDPFLHYRIRPYQGNRVPMADGAFLEKGDSIIELHFDNKKLYQLGTSSRTSVHLAIRMIRTMEKQLPDLARIAAVDPDAAQVKALYGVTMINRGPEQFGFLVKDLPKGWFAASSSVYLKILLSVIHPQGQQRLKEGSQQMVPKMIIMPMDVLYERFGSKNSPEPSSQKDVMEETYEEDESSILTGSTDLSRTPPVA
ncbi:polysaccharide deacetylase family protein [Paenibacillus sp. Marseille-Q4541]|uniref:YkoP family protein n=1 Tax=Paenibacillus sp. Marseille-Q4541 TaxID=2831522 RepID=UPI001BAD11E1|nr:polysaccharide deacetylase family protein [Paenibacillus sp. Marseille-Q4541]